MSQNIIKAMIIWFSKCYGIMFAVLWNAGVFEGQEKLKGEYDT